MDNCRQQDDVDRTTITNDQIEAEILAQLVAAQPNLSAEQILAVFGDIGQRDILFYNMGKKAGLQQAGTSFVELLKLAGFTLDELFDKKEGR